jgi:hypothetical protein
MGHLNGYGTCFGTIYAHGTKTTERASAKAWGRKTIYKRMGQMTVQAQGQKIGQK